MSDEAKELCILDLLTISKPVKESCFSETQIDMLFGAWKEFMSHQFARESAEGSSTLQHAREEVKQLFGTAVSVEDKYNALRLNRLTGVDGSEPAMGQHEREWVMNRTTPTPFIEYLRTQTEIMNTLKMSFKPTLSKDHLYEVPDIVQVLVRYEYWLNQDRKRNRTMNLLGVVDLHQTQSRRFVENLTDNWAKFRYHFAVWNDQDEWYSVLVDRERHTFEYYDPRARTIDLASPDTPISEQVLQLYEAAHAMDPHMMTKTSDAIRRGIRGRKGHRKCGLYVILFLHTRAAQNKTFKDFIEMNINDTQCKSVRNMFFTIPSASTGEEKITNREYRIAYGAYDLRLAAIEFASYISYVTSILDDRKVDAHRILNASREEVIKLIQSPVDGRVIQSKMMEVQRIVLQILPPQFKDYSGADLWFQMIQKVIQDPLTQHLRKVSSQGGKRSQKTVRVALGLGILNEVSGWKNRPYMHDQGLIRGLSEYTRGLIDHVFVPLLHFDFDNQRRFSVGMSEEEFVRQALTRQESTSFGVFLLREVDDWVKNHTELGLDTDLDHKYRNTHDVVKPFTLDNMNLVQNVVSKCGAAIQDARKLLQRIAQNEMQAVQKVSEPRRTIAPNYRVNQVIQMVQADIHNHYKGPLQPWTFPINVREFESTQHTRLPENFMHYNMTEEDLRTLAQSEPFMTYYAISHIVLAHNLVGSKQVDLMRVQVAGLSLIHFLSVMDKHSSQRVILCTLLDQLVEAVRTRPDVMGAAPELMDYFGRVHLSCKSERSVDGNHAFLDHAIRRYKEIMGQ